MNLNWFPLKDIAMKEGFSLIFYIYKLKTFSVKAVN